MASSGALPRRQQEDGLISELGAFGRRDRRRLASFDRDRRRFFEERESDDGLGGHGGDLRGAAACRDVDDHRRAHANGDSSPETVNVEIRVLRECGASRATTTVDKAMRFLLLPPRGKHGALRVRSKARMMRRRRSSRGGERVMDACSAYERPSCTNFCAGRPSGIKRDGRGRAAINNARAARKFDSDCNFQFRPQAGLAHLAANRSDPKMLGVDP